LISKKPKKPNQNRKKTEPNRAKTEPNRKNRAKSEKNRAKTKKTEPNWFELVFSLKNRTETGRFDPVSFFFFKISVWLLFFDKNRIEPKMITPTTNKVSQAKNIGEINCFFIL